VIKEETIESFFKYLKIKGDFNPLEKLLWGYFFIDSNRGNLQKVADLLNEKGYSFVKFFEAEKEDNNDLTEYYLHVEKQGTHTVESLLKLNLEFYSIANLHKVTYDGFDVGKKQL
jgi:hypothetical protein